MKGYATLMARVRRVEKQRRANRPKRTVIITIHPDEAPGDILGVGIIAGHVIERAPGERLEALYARARAELGQPPIMIASYAPEAPQPAPAPVPAPPAAPMPIDPYRLAGIGRKATRAELEAMAAVPVPPERLV